MTGFTTPDNIPYPNDYEQPADSPAALKANATAVQTALNKKSVHATAEANYVKGPIATRITDWNDAIASGFYAGLAGTGHPPVDTWDTSWMGISVQVSSEYIHQIAWPLSGYDPSMMMQRARTGGTWGGWSRLVNHPQSWSSADNLINFMHRGYSGGATKQRFATGLVKSNSLADAHVLDEWRVQCYDLDGSYTWAAIKIPESGVVSFPKGHALALQKLSAGEPIQSDQAVTVGMLAKLLDLVGVDAHRLSSLLFEPEPEPEPEESEGAPDGR